ncbi:MAG: DTW domain-containing protein [Deltaproteobacteria bacterium]|nr:DTW domain-containing protein [Deltaproteobacteria bacterium]
MRKFCWTCHRPAIACFCELTRPFTSYADFALVVHPYEAASTVGTAWILRRSISNLKWIRSKGEGLDSDPAFLEILAAPTTVPLLLFPGPRALNLNRAPGDEWERLVPDAKRPLFCVIDGTWTQAHATLRKSALLRSLPRVSFEPAALSEYGFKTQPHPACLSSLEGVHRVIELLASRGWGTLPPLREHDQMVEIFRRMVSFQLNQDRNPRIDSRVVRRHQKQMQ